MPSIVPLIDRARRFSALVGLCLPVVSGLPAAAELAAVPVIAVASGDDGVSISGRVQGTMATEVTARLEIRKTDTAGSVGSAQSRTVRLVPGETVEIATVSVSLIAGGKIEATLLLLDGTDIVASTTTMLTQPPDGDSSPQ